MRSHLFAFWAVFLICGKLLAAPPAQFDAANRLFDKGDFQGARAEYEKLVQSGPWSTHLFYNLGNADFRLGDKGAAFLAYERALALDPGQHAQDLETNLHFLRDATGAKLPLTPWYGRALSWTTANGAAWLASAAIFGICFSLVPLLGKKRASTLPAAFCCLALVWSSLAISWQTSQGEIWIVTADETKARTMPADNASVTATLPMGSQVRLRLERGPWLQVQLPDDSAVWISRDAVQPVRLKQKT